MSDEEYESRMKKIQDKNILREQKQNLRNERNKYKHNIKLPSTSKLIAGYLFVVLNAVLVYAMIAMWHFMDLTCLGILVTDIAAQVLTFMVYAWKATKENTKNGLVYEMAMKNSVEEICSSDENMDDEVLG